MDMVVDKAKTRSLPHEVPSVSTAQLAAVEDALPHAKSLDNLTIHLRVAHDAPPPSASEGMLDLFKKTVKATRAGAGLGSEKPLNGANAANELAKAKAQAEARIAERNRDTILVAAESRVGLRPSLSGPTLLTEATSGSQNKDLRGDKEAKEEHPSRNESERRLSVSDLSPTVKVTTAPSSSLSSFAVVMSRDVVNPSSPAAAGLKPTPRVDVGSISTSTTPPHSPPASTAVKSAFVAPSGPVFNKPPPVFVAPPAVQNQDKRFKLPPLRAPFTLGLQPILSRSPPPPVQTSSTRLSQSGVQSQSSSRSDVDSVFDSQVSSRQQTQTQDTEYSVRSPPAKIPADTPDDDDDDDSWRLDERYGIVPADAKEDSSMTWSTTPGDTAPLNKQEQEQDGKQRSVDDAKTPSDMDVDELQDRAMVIDTGADVDVNNYFASETEILDDGVKDVDDIDVSISLFFCLQTKMNVHVSPFRS